MWWRTSSCSSLLIYRPREDERLSWAGWLTYSGRFTHISGHLSATGRAQDGERTLARHWRSTAEPPGPIWQTQSVGPVRTCYRSVLLTVNIVSHNPAQSSSDNILSYSHTSVTSIYNSSQTTYMLWPPNYYNTLIRVVSLSQCTYVLKKHSTQN